jgi:diguanylate cyclase (GGDEF)-like protein/PAS domain S-box-containing protein
MSLRDKTLITVGLTITVVIAVIYAISQIVLLNSFIQLEEQYTRQTVERALNAIQVRVNSLDNVSIGWAARDQMIEFAQSGNQSFIDGQLGDEAFRAFNLHRMLIINKSGDLVYSKAFNLISDQEDPQTEDLYVHFQPDSRFLQYTGIQDSHKGILLVDEGPILIVARPIVNSRYEGPAQGTLILGRYLSDAEIDLISDTYQADATLYRLAAPDMPDNTSQIMEELSNSRDTVIRPISDQLIGGYTLLEDMYGEPILLLGVNSPRMIYQQGRSSLSYFVFLLFSVGGFFTLATVLLLERQILSRIANLSRRVIQIGESGNLSERVAIGGRDELSNLAGAIDRMLNRLQQASKALQESEAKFRSMAEASAAIIFIYQDHRFRYVNQVATQLFGYSQAEFEKMAPIDIIAPEMREDIADIMQVIEEGSFRRGRFEIKAVSMDGNDRWLEFTASPIEYEGAPAIIGTAYDITERKEAEQRLRYMSTHDALSDLYNRAFFEAELSRLERGRNLPISIVIIDIDGLKPTNDTCGHAAGDELIRRTGEVLRMVFRAEDIIARIGGDEFAVILPGIEADEAEKTRIRIRETLADHNQQYPHLPLRFSMGVASSSMPGSLVAVMHQADEQMYKEKLINKSISAGASSEASL